MAKKAIREVENKIKKILRDRVVQITELEERVEASKRQQAVAKEALDAVTMSGDVEAYQKAKADLRNAEDAIEMYSKRLDALENKPLVSECEYEKGVSEIMSTLGEISADAKKHIVERMEQIRIIASECAEEIAHGNRILHQWQHEIYRDKAEQTLATGTRIHMDSLEKVFADYSVPQFASYVLESESYKDLARQSR